MKTIVNVLLSPPVLGVALSLGIYLIAYTASHDGWHPFATITGGLLVGFYVGAMAMRTES